MAGSIAHTGLTTAQTMMETSSYNISNGMNPNFRKVTRQAQTLTADGQGVGVTTSAAERMVDVSQISDFQSKTSEVQYYDQKNSIQTSVQKIIGSKTEGQSLGEKITGFQKACESLALSPNVASRQTDFLFTLNNLCSEAANINTRLNDLRKNCDLGIATAVKDINAHLENIVSLNTQISNNGPIKAPVRDINATKDALETALRQLGSYIDIQTTYQPDGSVRVQTRSGIEIAHTEVAYFQFNPTPGMTPVNRYDPDPSLSSINAIEIQTSPTTRLDATNHFNYGKLAALIEGRDKIIPQIHAEYVQLMRAMRDQVNSLHNKGTGWPPATSLTGSRIIDDPALENFTGTGTVRIGVVDRNTGALAASLDLDLTALGTVTVQDLASTINASLTASTSGEVTCVCNASSNNALRISSSNPAHGIALVSIGGDATETSTRLGFSHYFGLNDLITAGTIPSGTPQPGIAGQLAIRKDIMGNPALISRGQLNAEAVPPAAPAKAIQNGAGNIIAAIQDVLQSPQTFAATGALTELTASFAGYASQIIATSAQDNAQTNTRLQQAQADYKQIESDISRYSGVNFQEEMAAMLEWQTLYAACSKCIKIEKDNMERLMNVV